MIKCPMEYGGEIVHRGVIRGMYGECVCAAHGEPPCQYVTSTGDLKGERLASPPGEA